MTIASKYNGLVGWRTKALAVFQLTRETVNDPATYRMTVKAIDTNEPGANQKEIGYFSVDYWGDPYSIIATGSTYVDVSDDFRTGKCPTSGKNAVIFESAFKGMSLYLSPASFQHLHPLAIINIQKYNLALLWGNDPNAKKVPFVAQTYPSIINYQTTQVDPEDAAKTINYAEIYGEDPNIRCIIEVDANTSYQLQQMPQFTFVAGLLDTAWFLGIDAPATGHLIISHS